jgi:hypothetical protein
MSKFLKFFLILAMLFTSSCAMIFNKKDVEVNFRSIPDGADVFVDGEKIGKTPISVRLIPDRNRVVLYTKDGFANREFNIHNTLADSRLRPGYEHTNCILDWTGFIFILPLISAHSPACSNFDQSVYFKALDKGSRINVLNQDVR